MQRVLKAGGRALIIDLRRDASLEGINEAVPPTSLGIFSRVLTRLAFRLMLLKRAYTKREFEQLLTGSKSDGAQALRPAVMILRLVSRVSYVHDSVLSAMPRIGAISGIATNTQATRTAAAVEIRPLAVAMLREWLPEGLVREHHRRKAGAPSWRSIPESLARSSR